MNYIHHLTGFFHRISSDNRLNPTHVSLYMALFQFWNVNHFGNPISICRQDLMKISKISAKATYHKCINDLHAYGYIVYEPSNNAFKGSFVTMRGFQAGVKLRPLSDRTKNETAAEPVSDLSRTIIGTGDEQALVPSINYINNTNPINKTIHTPNEISVVSDTHPTPVVTEPPLLQSPTEKKTKGGAA
ncbi:MAG: transcriptional regulator, partial [Bacteroidota bacterium]|nr:transcriptional regulator [Bacteroidota bacterium]